jgi:hypothetical protein
MFGLSQNHSTKIKFLATSYLLNAMHLSQVYANELEQMYSEGSIL